MMTKDELRKSFSDSLEKGQYPVISLLGLAVVQLMDSVDDLAVKISQVQAPKVKIHYHREQGSDWPGLD
jgi:hypothetical protein